MNRKEIIDQYKNRKVRIGVFQIRNLENNMVFVDSSTDLDKIWNRHRTELKFGSHRIQALQKDWDKLGEEKFAFEILAELDQDDDGHQNINQELKSLKEMYLEEMQTSEDKRYH